MWQTLSQLSSLPSPLHLPVPLVPLLPSQTQALPGGKAYPTVGALGQNFTAMTEDPSSSSGSFRSRDLTDECMAQLPRSKHSSPDVAFHGTVARMQGHQAMVPLHLPSQA